MLAKLDHAVGRFGVTQDIRQRLLGDAIDDQLQLSGKRGQLLREVTLDLKVTLAAGPRAEGD